MYRPLVTNVLEEAAKCYGNDSPPDDPMGRHGYDPYEVKRAVEYCRSEGLLGTRARFGKGIEPVGIDRWWAGGLTQKGMEELESRISDVRRFHGRMLSDRDGNTDAFSLS